jgi:hypothetical protein
MMKRVWLASVLALCAQAHAEQAKQADMFVDSIGVNTHITYTNTKYFQRWPQVLAGLEALHVRHIRDGFYPWSAGSVFYARHQQMHAAGIDCDYVLGLNATASQVLAMQELAGDMAYVEGPNEMDDHKGNDWVGSLGLALPAIAQAAAMAHVAVIGPAFTTEQAYAAIGNISPWITVNGLHVYFGGRNPGSFGWGSGNAEGHAYGSIAWWLDNANTDAPGKPSIVTETGYMAPSEVQPYQLPESVEAKYVPRTALEMFNYGIVKSYFYELLDEHSSPGYGLMRSDLSPKPAFTALSNLIGILSDPGPAFRPWWLDYHLEGGNQLVHHLLLQKRDRTYYMVFWIEANGYDPVTNQSIWVPSQNVTLTLKGAVAETALSFDDRGNVSPTDLKSSNNLHLVLTDNITVVKIRPGR